MNAQINSASAFPADFNVTSPASAVGTYDYGTQTTNEDAPDEWGPRLNEDLSGEIVWAYTDTDSLGCTAIVSPDVTGKFALIRRGVCGFSEKAYWAQEAGATACIIVNHFDDPAQDGNTLVGMLGIDSAQLITIPAIFISRNTGEIIDAALSAGETVNATFDVKSFYDPVSSYSYHTPITELEEGFNQFRINYVNPSETDAVDVAVEAVITAPGGSTETLVGSSNVAPLSDSVIILEGTYIPTELGTYTVNWTNDQSEESISSGFAVTEYTYAVDNGDLSTSVGPSDEQFAEANFVYEVGGIALIGTEGAIATHASFGISNASEIITDDPDEGIINIFLYDGDANNDNTIDFAATGASFADLTPVALGSYT
ncbi:MAG: PA domain-containing protein, partial [Bacteroidota bacterium]